MRHKKAFDFEDIIVNTNNLHPSTNRFWDAIHPDGTPISIKHRQLENDLCLSDALNFRNISQNYYLVIGTYLSDNEYYSIDCHYITMDRHNSWFGSVTGDHIQLYKKLVAEIDYGDIQDKRKSIQSILDYPNRNSGIAKLAPKISKNRTNKRIQCRMSRRDFEYEFPYSYNTSFQLTFVKDSHVDKPIDYLNYEISHMIIV